MIGAVIVLALAGLAAVAGLITIEIRERYRPGQYQSVELKFGRDVTPEAVTAVLDRVAGHHDFSSAAFEARADQAGIRHYLSADQATLDTLRTAFLAHLPTTQFEPAKLPPFSPSSGGAVRLRGKLGTLRSDNDEAVSVGLLASLQPLGPQERVVMRWLVRPARPRPVPSPRDGQLLEPEERRRLRIKLDNSQVLGHGTLAVVAGHPRRAAHLLARVTSALRTRNTAYGQIRALPRWRWWLRYLYARRYFLVGDRFSVAELGPLLTWPIGTPALPGVAVGTSPRRIPTSRLPSAGRVLGVATWPGAERPIAQPIAGAMSHTLIAGPTGVGKSTLLVNMIEQDMAAGRAVVLIDGKGDASAAVLARVPEHRRKDVIVLDCASDGPQPGLKLFGTGDRELAADVVLGVLSDLYRGEWGPLSERYVRAALIAVAHDGRSGTLADIPYVFTDPEYRRRLLPRMRDPLTLSTFAALDAMSPAERQQQLAAPLNKIGRLLGRPIVRTVLGQVNPRLDFTDVLRHRKIVVVSLTPARVGAPAARLVGALIVFALFQAVQARIAISERGRKPALVYVDEPRVLGDLPMPLDSLLEQARGLGVGLVLAPQSLRQLPSNVQAAALTNVATRIAFRQDADDARLLARDLAGVTTEDLGDLAAYEAIARINLGPGDLAPPVSIRTTGPTAATTDGRALARAAAFRDGQTLETVDASLDARHRPTADGPIGRKRRSA